MSAVNMSRFTQTTTPRFCELGPPVARRMRLQYIFYGEEKEPHPFHVKSDWDLPVQPSVALETFLEEVRFELATINIKKPKDNLSAGERCALKELSCDRNIILKKADKGTTTVIMNREDKIQEGQVLLHDINNYRPLETPIVDTTAKKVQRVIKSLLKEGPIDDMTAKWLSLTPNPPRIPVFYTLTKIHKPTPVGRPIISGCDGPTERISAFVDYLLQPIAQIQPSYLKDTTDFINFVEKTKTVNATAAATAVLPRKRNSRISAFAYRISSILSSQWRKNCRFH